MMTKKVFFLLFSFFLLSSLVVAQDVQKSDLHQRADAEAQKGTATSARSLYIHAFEEYVAKGQLQQGVECGTKAASMYSRDNLFKEAFEFLRRVDQTIDSNAKSTGANRAALHYQVTKERLQMYMKFRKADRAKEQMAIMESLANASNDEAVKSDLLYNKTVYYYSFGFTDKGNATFKEMATKLTALKEYDKVDKVYKTLIANGRKSNSAGLVAQSYSSYMAWKDSVSALKSADEIKALKQRIADDEAVISDKDSSLTTRQAIIVSLCILAVALAAALVFGGFVLMRYILLTRKQKKAIQLANENNALKAKFISNISAQLDPTLQKLDGRIPEVKALQDFSKHIQTLATVENMDDDAVAKEDTAMQSFCEELVEGIRGKLKKDVTLSVNVPKMTANINQEYVSHILRHLLSNAAQYTPEGGHITLDFKKRGPHTHQFLVSDTGCGIPEEQRDDLFKPFLTVRDLTTGDGLGLPICKQMALKMKGDLELDPTFSKGTRFILDLHS